MRLYRTIAEVSPPLTSCVFTFGTFDGVHLGHRVIFEAMQKKGHRAVFTFSNHPSEYLTPANQVLKLTSDVQKVQLLAPWFDTVVDVAFTQEICALRAEEFLCLLHSKLSFSEVVVGRDVRFGNRSEGNWQTLQKMGQALGFSCTFLERKMDISSSYIRALIQNGRLTEAAHFLGRPYSLLLPSVKGVVDFTGYAVPPEDTYEAVRDDRDGYVEVNYIQKTS